MDVTHAARKMCPMVLVGLGIGFCFLRERQRRWRCRMRRMEQRQEEILATLREIRDGLHSKGKS